MTKSAFVVAAIIGSLIVGAPSASGARATAAAATLKVKLFEYKIKLKTTDVPDGRVKFKFKNIGIEEHEVVIVRGDDPKALPAQNGVVDEAAIPEEDLVGESGEIEAKGSKAKTFTLEPGSYIMFCNVLHDHMDTGGHGGMDGMNDMGDGASSDGHFGEGMYVVITVG